MLSSRANIHGYSIPSLGKIGYLVEYTLRDGTHKYLGGDNSKYIVVYYSLCDNVQPYSKGIHTCYVKRLRDGVVRQISGMYFEAID